MGYPKCFEDNRTIYEERMRDKEENQILCMPIVKSKKQIEREKRKDVFCDKQGVINIIKRGSLAISMEFKQYIYPEWIEALKKHGWRWNHFKKYWYAPWSVKNYQFAAAFAHGKDFLKEEEDKEEEDDVYSDGYKKVL